MIKVLGADGSHSHKSKASSFLIEKHIAIDAGNIVEGMGNACCDLEHIFISHTHFDHIVDLPFIIESYFECRTKPLKIYTLRENIEKLQTHIFNWSIWPDFDAIPQNNSNEPSIQFIPIDFGETLSIDGVDITILKSNHTVPTCGFKITKNNHACVISGDTYLNPKLIELLNQDKNISSLIIEVSFSSDKAALADISQHMTPKLLEKMLVDLKRDDITIYTYHQKPLFVKKIDKELRDLNLLKNEGKRLETGDIIDIFSPPETSKKVRNILLKRDEKEHLANLFQISQKMQEQSNLPKLLAMIVEQSMKFTDADAATLYLLDEEKQELMFKVLYNETLDIHIENMKYDKNWPNLPLYTENNTPNNKLVAVMVALSQETTVIHDIYHEGTFDFEGTKLFDSKTGYRSVSMLVVPLINHENETIGVLQLINKQTQYAEVSEFDAFDIESTNALASQASIAITNTTLIHELQESFELFIATISSVINTKTKDTGNHVRRVSVIADMLAKALDKATTGKYKDVSYTTEELRQINLAALLHDVGKISTPEYIMNKSKKLEKITDRITLIDERIEILKRDVEINYLQKELALLKAQKNVPDSFDKAKQDALVALEEIHTFLHECNIGSEYLDDEKIKRLAELAHIHYYLDDKSVTLLRDDELENLSIQRGTLTDKERKIIHNHAYVSVEILESIKFPKSLKLVPNIACNHHERLDGTGYPKHLSEKDLTLEDRIMILADMFEALSASNRSYKVPNTMNEISAILKRSIDAGHIDKDLVNFFFESGVYKEYAKNELQPNQQDNVTLDFDA